MGGPALLALPDIKNAAGVVLVSGSAKDAEALVATLLGSMSDESVAGPEGRGNVGERPCGRTRSCPGPGSRCVNAVLSLPAYPVCLSACSFDSDAQETFGVGSIGLRLGVEEVKSGSKVA